MVLNHLQAQADRYKFCPLLGRDKYIQAYSTKVMNTSPLLKVEDNNTSMSQNKLKNKGLAFAQTLAYFIYRLELLRQEVHKMNAL